MIRIITAMSCIAAASIATACQAHAGPPDFPDLGKYTPAKVADYTIELPNTGGPTQSVVYFLTPDGITCSFGNPPGADCIGEHFPGTAPAGRGLVNWIGTDQPLQTTSDPIRNNATKLLPPNHSITVDGVICGVDGAGTTACKDPQGHGFILSPSWSGWLEHVA